MRRSPTDRGGEGEGGARAREREGCTSYTERQTSVMKCQRARVHMQFACIMSMCACIYAYKQANKVGAGKE